MYFILIILILSLLTSVSRKSHLAYFWTLFVLLAVTSGLRFNTGSDYFSYLEIFNEVKPLDNPFPSYESLYDFNVFVEYGYLYTIAVFKIFSESFNCYLFVCSILFTYVYLFSFKKLFPHSFIEISLLYFATGYMLLDMSGMRQYMAFSLFYFSVFLAVSEKIGKSILVALIGGFFHSSAFLLLPSLFYIAKPHKRSISLWLLGFSSALFIIIQFVDVFQILSLLKLSFLPESLADKIINYGNSDFLLKKRSLNFWYLIYFIILIRNLISPLKNTTKPYYVATNLTLMFFLYSSLFAYSEDFSVRVSTYFLIGPLALLVGYLKSKINDNRANSFVLFLLCLIFLRSILFEESYIMFQPYYNAVECYLSNCDYSLLRHGAYIEGAK